MNDVNNKGTMAGTIADKIHQAVSSLLDTEARLNADLHEARSIAHEQKRDIERLQGQIAVLQSQLDNEQNVRRHLQDLISKVAELMQKRA
jgi:capsule polysaccharide export protein KpsE/RkpR